MAALGAVIIAGGIVFARWQGQTDIVLTSNMNGSGKLPASGDKPAPPRIPLEKGTPDHLVIADRKIDAPIVYIDGADEKTFQDALTKGVVHYPDTALPGEAGNMYIFGHSSDYKWKPGNYKQVFKPLVDIPIGTVVRITNHEGKLFIYKVTETKIVGPKDTSVLDQQNNERKLLTLQTSWPVGTALKRFVAVSELDEEATYGPQNPPPK